MTIPAYPLEWPAGWKRTAAQFRTASKFGKAGKYEGYGENKRWVSQRDLTIAEATNRVRDQLQKMGVRDDDLVISTNLELRLDGLPRSGQKEPKDPGAAVYWRTGKSDTRCMAIDRYDRVADNLAAIAATLDAMRAIERHGGAAILDRAFTGFAALPAPMVAGEPWYVVLDCDPDSEPEVVEQCYRWKRSDTHPDRGGSTDAFDKVQRAYQQWQEL